MRRLLLVILLVSCLQAQEITLFNKSFNTAADSAAGTSTSFPVTLPTLNRNAGGKFMGLLTVALNYDSLVALSANDSFIVFLDFGNAGDWVPTDTLTFNISTTADAAFSSTTTVITTAHKDAYLTAFINPTPAATTPTQLTHLSWNIVRARIVKINGVQGRIRLDLVPF